MNDFQTQYKSFVQEHGNLYEEKVVPMDEEDLKRLTKFDWQYRKVAFPILLALGCCTLVVLIYMIINKDLVYIIGMGLSTISCLSLSLYVRVAYKGLLEKKEKTLVTGIVTKKTKHGGWGYEKYFGLSISDKVEIFGYGDEFMDFAPGDIIQYEKFESERNKYKKPKRLGNISDFK